MQVFLKDKQFRQWLLIIILGFILNVIFNAIVYGLDTGLRIFITQRVIASSSSTLDYRMQLNLANTHFYFLYLILYILKLLIPIVVSYFVFSVEKVHRWAAIISFAIVMLIIGNLAYLSSAGLSYYSALKNAKKSDFPLMERDRVNQAYGKMVKDQVVYLPISAIKKIDYILVGGLLGQLTLNRRKKNHK